MKYAPRKRRPTLLAVRWRDKARWCPTFIQVCFTRGVPFVRKSAGVEDGPEEIFWWSGADLRNGGGPSASLAIAFSSGTGLSPPDLDLPDGQTILLLNLNWALPTIWRSLAAKRCDERAGEPVVLQRIEPAV